MENLRKDYITLTDAMTKNVDHRIRTWFSPDLHLENREAIVPKDATLDHTFIMRFSATKWQVVLCWFFEGELYNHFHVLNEFSSWEELKQHYPQFLELKGHLCVFP